MPKYRALLSATVLALLLAGCGTPPPSADFPATSLAIHFEVVDNHQDAGASFEAALTLTNGAATVLAEGGWELYFNFGRMISASSLPDSIAVAHVNGDLFQLTPTDSFAPLEPGESLRVSFKAQNWLIKEVEAPSGLYVVTTDAAGHEEAKVLEVTIGAFTTAQQTDRMIGDLVPVPTPALRYAEGAKLTRLAADEVSPIVPTPLRLERGDGQVSLDATWKIHHGDGLEGEAAYLAEALTPILGETLKVSAGAGSSEKAIVLELAEIEPGAEAYRLTLAPGAPIRITGTDAAGVFYGIESLRALLPPTAATEATVTLPAMTVTDAPRFHYRGMHLDVARNFQSKEAVLKLLDLMAIYKLNVFHFHLTDDEGWRLAIDALPELVRVGSRRGHTRDESDRILPSFGSGPDPASPHGSGHYTRADFIEILRHADARHIEVIPELDVPGHARAAIRAMAARQDPEYLLIDSEDTSEYMSVQMWKDNVINVCLPSTYHFLRTVIDDVVAMYSEAGVPLKTIHTGGDEVPEGVWEKSPACERLIEEGKVASVSELPTYFLLELSALLAEHGLVTAGWEEIVLREEQRGEQTVKVPNEDLVGKGFRPYVWNNVWGWGAEDLAYQLANAGFEVVMSNATNLYFDLAYDKDPAETGYYWAGLADTRKPWEFVPFDLFQNGTHDRMGKAIDPASFAGHVRVSAAGRRNILGIQGQLWGENAKGQEVMEYLAFPRLLSLAERAWAAPPAWASEKDASERQRQLDDAWSSFANSLGQRELPRLDSLLGGVAYRLPLPGGVVKDGQLLANVAFPGLEIRYTTDGSEPTMDSTLYTGPVAVEGTVRLRTFDTRGRGSRTTVVSEFSSFPSPESGIG
jgi:hexosaminidase